MRNQINNYIILKWIKNPYFTAIIFIVYLVVLRSAVVYAEYDSYNPNHDLIEIHRDGRQTIHHARGEKTEIMPNGVELRVKPLTNFDKVFNENNAPGYWGEYEMVGETHVVGLSKHPNFPRETRPILVVDYDIYGNVIDGNLTAEDHSRHSSDATVEDTHHSSSNSTTKDSSYHTSSDSTAEDSSCHNSSYSTAEDSHHNSSEDSSSHNSSEDSSRHSSDAETENPNIYDVTKELDNSSTYDIAKEPENPANYTPISAEVFENYTPDQKAEVIVNHLFLRVSDILAKTNHIEGITVKNVTTAVIENDPTSSFWQITSKEDIVKDTLAGKMFAISYAAIHGDNELTDYQKFLFANINVHCVTINIAISKGVNVNEFLNAPLYDDLLRRQYRVN